MTSGFSLRHGWPGAKFRAPGRCLVPRSASDARLSPTWHEDLPRSTRRTARPALAHPLANPSTQSRRRFDGVLTTGAPCARADRRPAPRSHPRRGPSAPPATPRRIIMTSPKKRSKPNKKKRGETRVRPNDREGRPSAKKKALKRQEWPPRWSLPGRAHRHLSAALRGMDRRPQPVGKAANDPVRTNCQRREPRPLALLLGGERRQSAYKDPPQPRRVVNAQSARAEEPFGTEAIDDPSAVHRSTKDPQCSR